MQVLEQEKKFSLFTFGAAFWLHQVSTKDVASTAENLALWFFKEVTNELERIRKDDDLWELEEVVLFETDKNIATIRRE